MLGDFFNWLRRLLGMDAAGAEKFPVDIAYQCKSAKQRAKNCVVDCGGKRLREKNITVTTVKGQEKVGSIWRYQFQHPTQGLMWVGGWCNGNHIEVARDPNTGEVNKDVLFHEFGHYWLMCSYQDVSHNPKYTCFNWSHLPNNVHRHVTRLKRRTLVID